MDVIDAISDIWQNSVEYDSGPGIPGGRYLFIATMLGGLYFAIVDNIRFIVKVILPIIFGVISICCISALSVKYGFANTMLYAPGILLSGVIFYILMFEPVLTARYRDDDIPWYRRAMQPRRIVCALLTFSVPTINSIYKLSEIRDPVEGVVLYALLYMSIFLGLLSINSTTD